VGSNDLVQFLYAVDRGNPRVSTRFDPLSAPVLRALRDIADKGRTHKKLVTLCGELASQPIGAIALVAIGYRALSLTPSVMGPVKAALLELDCRKAAEFLCPLIEKPNSDEPIRARLQEFTANKASKHHRRQSDVN
jgi:phosphotransferase system enzyme I (PtsP)